jgi:hypothetical protein
MKRSLVSKKFLRNAAIVLAIAVVAYVVMYGVKEGFQDKSEVIEYIKIASNIDASSSGYIIQKPSSAKKLINVELYTWNHTKKSWDIQKPADLIRGLWDLSTITYKDKSSCAKDKLTIPTGKLNTIQLIKDCSPEQSKKITVNGANQRETALDLSNKEFIYVKYPGKAINVPNWSTIKSAPAGTEGVDKKAITKEANLAIKYIFE